MRELLAISFPPQLSRKTKPKTSSIFQPIQKKQSIVAFSARGLTNKSSQYNRQSQTKKKKKYSKIFELTVHVTGTQRRELTRMRVCRWMARTTCAVRAARCWRASRAAMRRTYRNRNLSNDCARNEEAKLKLLLWQLGSTG